MKTHLPISILLSLLTTAPLANANCDPLPTPEISDVRTTLVGNEWKEDRVIDATATKDGKPLPAIHSLARFVALHSPQHIAWCEEICFVPFKKCTQTPAAYLEKAEIDALLAAPSLKSAHGQRDHLLLLFLYNTGTQDDETAQVLIRDLNLAHAPGRDLSWVMHASWHCMHGLERHITRIATKRHPSTGLFGSHVVLDDGRSRKQAARFQDLFQQPSHA